MSEIHRSDGRLRLTIIGGFLGAGKSTWLRHQLHERRFGPVHVLVNEAAETPVDDLLLGKAEQIEVLAGGCACCEGRGALVAALRRICGEQDSANGEMIGRILLETSGLADPAAIAEIVSRDPMLARRLAVDESIVLVDAVNGPLQLAQEYLGRRQVEAAGRIVITKIRGTPTAQLLRLVSTLRVLNPTADIEGAERGTLLELPANTKAESYELPALQAIEPIRPYRLDVSGGGGWAGFSVWLSALIAARGDEIVRVKGVIESPAGRLLLQSVRRVVQPPEILPEPAETGARAKLASDFIILIGRGMNEEALTRSWAKFVVAGSPE